MNWDAIGAIAELLGAIGVIASLIYLATQIRQSREQMSQNTRALPHTQRGARRSCPSRRFSGGQSGLKWGDRGDNVGGTRGQLATTRRIPGTAGENLRPFPGWYADRWAVASSKGSRRVEGQVLRLVGSRGTTDAGSVAVHGIRIPLERGRCRSRKARASVPRCRPFGVRGRRKF